MPGMSWHGMPLQTPWPRGPLRMAQAGAAARADSGRCEGFPHADIACAGGGGR